VASEAPVKVLHVITRMVRGGAARIVLALCDGLRRRRFDVLLAAGGEAGPEGSLWDEAEALGIPSVRLPALIRRIAPSRDLAALAALRALCRARRPDIVHAHTSKAGLIGCLAARMEGVPAVVLAPHGHILAPGARIPGVPNRGLMRRLLAAAARRSARHADLVIAPNEHEREDGIRHGAWTEERSTVVPNGVDTDLFRPRDRGAARAAIGLPRAGFVLGVAARLTPEKGIDYAIEALTCVPGAVLVIAGDGPERARLAVLAQSLGVAGRVMFAGLRARMEEILPAFDTFLAPSRTEAHGMAAAEALACGVPVIAFAVGGLRSIVLGGVTGLLAAPGDVESFAAAARLLAADPALRARLGRAGREHVCARFSLNAMLAQTVAVYTALLRRKGREPDGVDRGDVSRESGRVRTASRQ